MPFGRVRPLASGRHQARVTIDGQNHCRSFDTEDDALLWLNGLERLTLLKQSVDPMTVTLATYGEKVLVAHRARLEPSSWRGYVEAWNAHVGPALGEERMASLTRGQVRRWLDAMTTAGQSPSIQRRSLSVLAVVCNAAMDDEIIKASPAARQKIHVPGYRPRELHILRPADVWDVDAALPEIARDWLLVAGHVGLRYGEIAGLRPMDVDLVRSRVFIRSVLRQNGTRKDLTKSGKDRTLTMTRESALRLAGRMQGLAPDDLLFTTITGQPWRYQNWWRTVWIGTWEKLVADDPKRWHPHARWGTTPKRHQVMVVGPDGKRSRQWVPWVVDGKPLMEVDVDVHAHDFRASCASWMAEAAGILAASQRLGHSNTAVTAKHYARARLDDSLAVHALDAYIDD